MGQVNVGTQSIGWKYSTPLQADYLNTFISGISTPGLLSRPKIEVISTNNGATVTIKPFSLLINPTDSEKYVTEDGKTFYPRLVKITTADNAILTVFPETVAIGFTYSFKDEGVAKPSWYGDFMTLDQYTVGEFEGVIVATCQSKTLTGGTTLYSVSTSGADISNALLIAEGWNPRKWLSLVHPKRSAFGSQGVKGIYNRLEIRSDNDLYRGYINGNLGTISLQTAADVTIQIDPNEAVPGTDPYNERGKMTYNYNTYRLQTRGFEKAQCGNSLPIVRTSGGIFAFVDATDVNYAIAHEGSGSLTPEQQQNGFANKLKISPVEQEDINIYYYNNTLTIN